MSVPSSRRQSNRAVRSTATRPHNYYARAPQNNAESPTPTDAAQRTFPAIEHFTDTMAALPHDMARHMTMMTEVYAKLHTQEEDLAEIAGEMSQLPRPARVKPGTANAPTADQEAHRQALMRRFNYRAFQMQPILDEKIAVLSAANLELSNLLKRAHSSYRHLPEEISAEARLGSSKHWAYVTEKETKKVGNERTRREVAAANHATAATLGNHHQDSDFDDRANARKNKGKGKHLEATNAAESRLAQYINANGQPAQPKRKKAAAGATGPEKSLAAALAAQKRPPGSPTLGIDEKKKRKTAPGPAPAKKRVQTGESKTPKPFSSPAIGTFNVERPSSQRGGHSRARNSSQVQIPHINAPQPSTEGPRSKQPTPISTPTVAPVSAPEPADVIASNPEPQRLDELRISQTEDKNDRVPLKGDEEAAKEGIDTQEQELKTASESVETGQPITQTAAAAVANNQRNGRTSKTSTPITGTFPDSNSNNSRNASRSARTKDGNGNSGSTANGSHASSESGQGERMQREKRKRIISRKAESNNGNGDVVSGAVGNGNDTAMSGEDAATTAVAATGPNNEDEEEDEEVDGDEPLYCYCNEVSYGEMVACDNDQCVKQWFHLSCAGLSAAPTSAKWYCDDCKAKFSRRGRRD